MVATTRLGRFVLLKNKSTVVNLAMDSNASKRLIQYLALPMCGATWRKKIRSDTSRTTGVASALCVLQERHPNKVIKFASQDITQENLMYCVKLALPVKSRTLTNARALQQLVAWIALPERTKTRWVPLIASLVLKAF
jgi:hypothetical protein